MRILFLCSSIEIGNDGVGDYTTLICCDLVKKGHEVSIIALCDKYIKGTKVEKIVFENSFYDTVRIATDVLQKQRFDLCQNIVSKFNPDYISLQFVPYGFNKKGLPFWLAGFLNRLKGNHSWQFMIHELWIGRNSNVSFKDKVVSYLQEGIIKHLIRKTNPQIVHTHLPIYRTNLENFGFNIKPLPLFSNITPLEIESQSLGIKRFRWGFFSQVNADSDIINFINTFNEGLKKLGILPELVIIGGNKEKMRQYVEEFKSKCPLLTAVYSTGFLINSEISYELSKCDLGVTPVPRHAIGKSGSVAAFLAHGIPVAAPIQLMEYSVQGIGLFIESWKHSIMIDPNVNNIQKTKKVAEENKKMFCVDQICDLFLKDLQSEK